MIYLYSSATSASVKGFWIVVLLLYTKAAAAVHTWLVPSRFFLYGCLFVALVLVVVATLRPELVQTAYQMVGCLIRNRLVPFARRWILSVVFFLVILINRPFGKERMASASSKSGWLPREFGASGSLGRGSDGEPRGSWLAPLREWIAENRNWWVYALIPFMLMLSLFSIGEERHSQSTETYTLF